MLTQQMKYRRILIADDHPLILSGLHHEIDKLEGYQLVKKAQTGSEAWQYIEQSPPHIAILDIRMGDPSGLKIAERIQAQSIPTKVILLTMHKKLSYIERARQLDVKGYLLKEHLIQELTACLHTVDEGEYYLSQALKVIEAENAAPQYDEVLSRMEKKVFQLIGEEKSTKEIADMLFLSIKTIESHRSNISKKLGLAKNSSLVVEAVKARLNRTKEG